jgi:hypothetical protein
MYIPYHLRYDVRMHMSYLLSLSSERGTPTPLYYEETTKIE